MEQRFIRNIPSISEAEQRALGSKRAAVIGCGGLGGHIAEHLARIGLGGITVADGDSFEPSNLNRQILSLDCNMGVNKACAAAQRIKAIAPHSDVRCFAENFGGGNAETILADADIVLDALDNVPSRLLLEAECAKRGLTIVHGAVQGWTAQVCAAAPGSGMLGRLYGSAVEGGKSVLSPVSAFCAAIQCAEAVKLLCLRESQLLGRVLIADMLSMDFELISL